MVRRWREEDVLEMLQAAIEFGRSHYEMGATQDELRLALENTETDRRWANWAMQLIDGYVKRKEAAHLASPSVPRSNQDKP